MAFHYHYCSEFELIPILKSGDEKSFAYLYDHYAASLLRLIKSIIRDEEIATDILQNVFIKIWQNINEYDSKKGRLFTWMINIARNESIDILRSKAYRKIKRNVSLSDADMSNFHTQESYKMDMIGLQKHFMVLTPNQKIIVELIFIHGHKPEEVSKMLNTPFGTVKTRIRSALITLRKSLQIDIARSNSGEN